MVASYDFVPGRLPILVSLPHDSTYIPPDLAARMTDPALKTPDTDWHVATLYDFSAALGASILTATHSRYVIDLNRDPSGKSLYSGTSNTELCPLTTFDFAPIYDEGEVPTQDEIDERIESFWRPYHDKIESELAKLKSKFGIALLFDGHTIRSEVSRFYKGRIPDLNLGTASGASASPELTNRAHAILQGSEYSVVLDDRFTGGYITRHYGDPENSVHAIQLELTWRNYMDEKSFKYAPERASRLKPVLRVLLETLIQWSEEQQFR